MADRTHIEELLEYYRLDKRHADHCKASFIELRPSYHNEEHCYSTAATFHELALRLNLPHEGARHGFLAALYHDANHRMAQDDTANIAAAIGYLKATPFLESDLDFYALARLIGATLNTRTEFTTLTERLLHDADLLQTVKGDWQTNETWQARLSEELLIAVDLEGSLKYVVNRIQVPETLDFLKDFFFQHLHAEQ